MTSETRKEIVSWIKVVVIAVVAAFIINRFIIIHATVPTGSMMDTIPEKSRIVAFRLSYLLDEPKRYDIVIFPAPDSPDVLFVKRIIGMPGETIRIIGGKVYLEGSDEPLDDFFIRELSHDTSGPYHIPEGCYFMMGDNRTNSEDSRRWNHTFLERDQIQGKLLFSYYPKLKWVR